MPEWIPTPENIQYNNAVQKLDRIVYRIIKERRETLKKEMGELRKERKDLLTRLLQVGNFVLSRGFFFKSSLKIVDFSQARDDDGSGMDDVALRDELMTLLVAVHLSTVTYQSFLLNLLL